MGLGDWEGRADFPGQGRRVSLGFSLLAGSVWGEPGAGSLVWSLVWGPLSRGCSASCFLEGPLSRSLFFP